MKNKDTQGTVFLPSKVFQSIAECRQLQTLRIHQFEIESLSILEQLDNLENLVLEEVYVEKPLDASHFSRLSRLETIDLSRSQYLAKSILGNEDIKTHLENVKHLKMKNSAIEDLNWVPDKSVDRFFPLLSTVDISQSTLNCQDEQIRKILCRFKNLKQKAMEVDADESESGDNHPMTLENSDSIACDHHQYVSSIDFSYCLKDLPSKTNIDENWPDISGRSLDNPDPFHIPFSDGKPEENGSSNVGYIILGVILFLLVLAAVILAVVWHRRRQGMAKVPSSPEQGDAGTTQTFSQLQKCSSVQNESQINSKC